MYSLQQSLTRQLLLKMLLVMGGLLILLYFSVYQLLQEYIVTRLQHDTETLVNALEYDPSEGWHVNTDQVSPLYHRVKSGHYYLVDTGRRELASRSLFDAEFPLPEGALPDSGSYTAPGYGEEAWLIWQQQVNKQGQALRVWVAEDIGPIQLELHKYTAFAILLVLVATGILVFLQQRTLKRSFAVFELMRSNLSSIRQRKTEALGIEVPEEIMPLVHEIENLIDQLSQRVERTRHAVGNLAHELKRPLQLLTMQRDAGVGQLREPLEEIRSIIDRELTRARIAGSRDLGGKFDPDLELSELIAVLEKIYPQIDVCVNTGNAVGELDLDRGDMLELIGNLLDNACKFARSRVEVHTTRSLESFTLSIEDDGRRLAPEQMENLQARGVRLDESVAGHGLGLGICRDILESYRGTMRFSESVFGGLKVEVDIPLGDKPA